MTDITLIFPDQLFKNHPAISSSRVIYLVEEFLFYKVQPFHKQRLVLLKAAMRAYRDKLLKNKKEVIYISSKELKKRGSLFELLAKNKVKNIHLAEFADDWLSQDLLKASKKYHWDLFFYPSPSFICSTEELKEFFKSKKHYSMAEFYIYQRKMLDILMDGKSPLGGKYSFDSENRKKLPKKMVIPPPFTPKKSPSIEQIIQEVEKEFPDAIGNASPFLYPTIHEEADCALEDFLKYKFLKYGDYQDAIDVKDSSLFHSKLSLLINIGLLTPQEVIQKVLNYSKENKIPLNSTEGFLRQIIGWREFVRASYLFKGSLERTLNFFNHEQKIPKSFWEGETGILPIDITVKKLLKTGYCNHIERLMILGNFLLLTETNPNEVYKWFMAYFIDAYDWVMIPNVYGMSQYADGGIIVTKPYISASNYILKMSNYPKGEWTEIWDGLFWRFLFIHKSFFSSNYRLGALVNLLNKNEDKYFPKIEKAEKWLEEYRKEVYS